MTDLELLAAASKARGLAHRAPFAEWSKDHHGHSFVVNHTTAFADRATEFVSLATEIHSRGLVLPPCDCPASEHADSK